jgi:hypothetical protein
VQPRSAQRIGRGVPDVPVLPPPSPSACTWVRASAARASASAVLIIAAPPNKAERPGRGFRQAGKNDAGKDEVDNSACQHPAPAAGELCVPRGAPRQRGKSILRGK